MNSNQSDFELWDKYSNHTFHHNVSISIRDTYICIKFRNCIPASVSE